MERNTQTIAEDATARPSEPLTPRLDPTSWNGVSYEDLMGSLEEQLSERQTLPRTIGTITAPMPTVIVEENRPTVPNVDHRDRPTEPAPLSVPPDLVDDLSEAVPPPRRERSLWRSMGRAIFVMTILGIAAGVSAAYANDGGVGERRAVSAWIARHVPEVQAATQPPPAAPAAQPIATTAPAPTTTTPAPITAQAAPTMIAPKAPPPMKWKKRAKPGTKDDETTEIDDATSVLDRALEP